MVDVVNEKDEIIGREWRNICHKKGLRHRTAGVLIFNDKDEILLQKRAEIIKTEPKKYDISAGGHVCLGMTPLQGVITELRNELGISCKLNPLIDKGIKQNNNMDNKKIRHILYVFKGKHNGPFKLQESELSNVKFFKIDKVKDMVSKYPSKFADAFKLAFVEYLKNES